MPFASPLALLGLAFVPLVLAFYMLKLRRDEHVVPSTLLWSRLMADVEANAPWQRLRRSLLLLLQLLLVAALALLAARPFLEHPATLARDLVLVVDASASMGATDVQPNRLSVAKQAALDALRDLPTGGRVSVIEAGRTARVVSNASTDLGRVRQAVGSIEVSNSAGNMGDALRLASALAQRSGDAQILVATDGALGALPGVKVDAPIKVVQVGQDRKNQAIVALAVRTAPSAVTRSVFVSVANLDLAKAERRVELYGDGRLIEARDVYIDPVARADVSIDDVPRDVSVVEVRLVGGDSSDTESGPPDQLAVDDRAWAVVPSDHRHRILLVGAGDPYLETALSYLPNSELYGVTADAYGPSTHPELFDLIVFESNLPATLPATPTLAIAPPRSSPLGDVTGSLADPAIGSLNPDEPLLRYVDLSTVHVSAAQKLALPDWARTVIPGPGGSPLLYSGERAGLRSAVLAFEPRRSDLPLQVAFPILVANLAGELLGATGTPTDAVAPGNPVPLSIPSGATGLRVTRPDGTSVDLAPGTVGGSLVTFSQTEQVGVYTVAPLGLASASPSAPDSSGPAAGSNGGGSASALGPSPSAVASGASVPPGASTAATTSSGPTRFAVDLFDVAESNITPGNASAIEVLGAAPAAASPGSGANAASSAATSRPPARDELWGPVVAVALALLCLEWAIYQRDALIRLRRNLLSRRRAT